MTTAESSPGIGLIHLDQVGRVDRENRVERLECTGPLERRRSGEHLVQHDAQREEIGASINIFATHLFGRHVAGGADDASRSSCPCRHRGAPSPASCSFATPKSRIFTAPSRAMNTFSGFRSRWTMPRACAAARPRATPSADRDDVVARIGPGSSRARSALHRRGTRIRGTACHDGRRRRTRPGCWGDSANRRPAPRRRSGGVASASFET